MRGGPQRSAGLDGKPGRWPGGGGRKSRTERSQAARVSPAWTSCTPCESGTTGRVQVCQHPSKGFFSAILSPFPVAGEKTVSASHAESRTRRTLLVMRQVCHHLPSFAGLSGNIPGKWSLPRLPEGTPAAPADQQMLANSTGTPSSPALWFWCRAGDWNPLQLWDSPALPDTHASLSLFSPGLFAGNPRDPKKQLCLAVELLGTEVTEDRGNT